MVDGVDVAHDEFRGMGLSGVSWFMDEGAAFMLFAVAGSLAALQANVFVAFRQAKYPFVQAVVAALRIVGLPLSTMTTLKTSSQTVFQQALIQENI